MSYNQNVYIFKKLNANRKDSHKRSRLKIIQSMLEAINKCIDVYTAKN